ncbi:MAG: T9SS type A sorting domain-containing protein [Bacteroidetes bacterium]|nr:T9SS type A sorting domain-containing protein [Bacteroidota bacterium]
MKKLVLFSASALLFFGLGAQMVPNGDFTVTTGTTNWKGTAATLVPGVNVTVNGTPQYLKGIDGGSYAFCQNTQVVSTIFTDRFAFTNRPVALSFLTCYLPAAAGETPGVIVYLSKWNSGTNKRDTILYNMIAITTNTIFPWRELTLNLSNYKSASNPDSAFVQFITTVNSAPKVSTAQFIDNVKFVDWAMNSTQIDNHFSGEIKAFPNPVANGKDLSVNYLLNGESQTTIELFDMTGRMVKPIFTGKEDLGNQNHSFSTAGLNAGTYLLSVKTGSFAKTQIISVK